MKKDICIIILVIIFATIAVLIYWIRLIQSKIDCTFTITKAYTKDLMLSDLIKGSLVFRIKAQVVIINKSSVTIPMRNFKLYLYYNNTLIAKTTKSSNFKMKKRASSTHDEIIQCIVNENAIELSKLIISKSPVDIHYKATGNIFFMPFSVKDKYKIT